jgi:hypothetical protein
MVKIYISSTYEDLKKEREAAAQVIRRLGHHPIYMEDYVAADKRPLEKCLDDVRSSDAYVGIFAWRYGFIPDGFAKSITHLEYEAAGQAGIPRLVFLLHDKASWPVEFVSTGADREKIDKFRADLKKERIISFFKNADELGGLVSAAISREFPPTKTAAPPCSSKPKLGSLVSKMIDRIPQVKDFMRFFREHSKKCPGRPQFYFIHGDEWQGHECLLERLMNTCLKEYAEEEWGREFATIKIDEVPWPKEGSLEDRVVHLKMNVMEKFAGFRETPDLSALSLARLSCFDKRPLVLIKHNIYSEKWDNHTQPLLSHYLEEFWAGMAGDEHEPMPRFLVFFNVRYRFLVEPGLLRKMFKRKAFSKELIRTLLENLSATSPGNCPCLLLRELTPIERDDVLDWFSEYDIFEFEADKKNCLEAIFREEERPVTSISWAKAEKALAEIVNEYRRLREEQLL